MRILLCIVGLVMLAGCDGHSVVPVSGHVTLDGQPLANAVVQFEPIGGNPNPGMGSVGRTDVDGRFVLRQIQPDRAGALVGLHRVVIRMAPSAPSPNESASKDRLPPIKDAEKERTFIVPPGGSNVADFPLVSAPKPPPA
jgi:hypothetical protein